MPERPVQIQETDAQFGEYLRGLGLHGVVVPRSVAENLIASLEAVQTDLEGDSDWTRERWDDAVFNALAEARDAVAEYRATYPTAETP